MTNRKSTKPRVRNTISTSVSAHGCDGASQSIASDKRQTNPHIPHTLCEPEGSPLAQALDAVRDMKSDYNA